MKGANPLEEAPFNTRFPSVSALSPSKTAGVALVAMSPGLKLSSCLEALSGRLLIACVEGPSLPRPLLIAVIYAPDSGKGDIKKERFWHKCHALIPPQVDLVVGDFNLTLRPEDSTSSAKHPRPRGALQSLLDSLGLGDFAPQGAPTPSL